MMRAEILDEPELEFGGGNRHIDPRFGISNYGPADLTAADAPTAIRVGLIGPADHLGGLRTWLERYREPIAAKDERYPHLFPGFPGYSRRSGSAPRGERPLGGDVPVPCARGQVPQFLGRRIDFVVSGRLRAGAGLSRCLLTTRPS
jgi:hypothetical protein